MTTTLNLAQYNATIEKIAKINERAAKRGLAGRLALVVDTEQGFTTRKVCEHDRSLPCAAFEYQHHFEQVVDIEIGGTAPKHEGWTFAARVDRVGDSFTLATAPGVEHVSREGIVLGHCDHCSTNRLRKTTYILRSEAGEQVQVGSTCIKDFLGWEGNIAWLDVPEVNDEWLGGGSYYAEPQYAVTTVVRLALASIALRGFVSAQAYGQTSTREHVALAFASRLTEAEKAEQSALYAAAEEITDAQVAEVITFIASDDFSGTSTYVENLKVIVVLEFIGSRQFGLLVSAPQALAKFKGEAVVREAKKASEWIGTVGAKVTATITIERKQNVGSFSYAGPDSYLIVGRTAEGEIVKTFTTAAWLTEVDVADTITLTATVKAHETYEGTKQTAITRAKKEA